MIPQLVYISTMEFLAFGPLGREISRDPAREPVAGADRAGTATVVVLSVAAGGARNAPESAARSAVFIAWPGWGSEYGHGIG